MLTKPVTHTQLQAFSNFLGFLFPTHSGSREHLRWLSCPCLLYLHPLVYLPPLTLLAPPGPDCCSQLRGPTRSARNTLPAQLLKLPLFPEMQILTPSRSLLPLSRGEGMPGCVTSPCRLLQLNHSSHQLVCWQVLFHFILAFAQHLSVCSVALSV